MFSLLKFTILEPNQVKANAYIQELDQILKAQSDDCIEIYLGRRKERNTKTELLEKNATLCAQLQPYLHPSKRARTDAPIDF